MVIQIENSYKDHTPADLAKTMVGKRAFFGWPFLREGLVVAISDAQFKYVKVGNIDLPSAQRHSPEAAGVWRRKVQKLQELYSKRFGVMTSDIDVLLHAHPLKGAIASSLCGEGSNVMQD